MRMMLKFLVSSREDRNCYFICVYQVSLCYIGSVVSISDYAECQPSDNTVDEEGNEDTTTVHYWNQSEQSSFSVYTCPQNKIIFPDVDVGKSKLWVLQNAEDTVWLPMPIDHKMEEAPALVTKVNANESTNFYTFKFNDQRAWVTNRMPVNLDSNVINALKFMSLATAQWSVAKLNSTSFSNLKYPHHACIVVDNMPRCDLTTHAITLAVFEDIEEEYRVAMVAVPGNNWGYKNFDAFLDSAVEETEVVP